MQVARCEWRVTDEQACKGESVVRGATTEPFVLRSLCFVRCAAFVFVMSVQSSTSEEQERI